MDDFDSVLCFCPSSRLSAASLVLSTWARVRRFVFTEDESQVANLDGYSAVLVMDRFVTKELVAKARATVPVVVLGWNGRFEIDDYREQLGDLDVIYMGTDESLGPDVPFEYVPMLNADCSYARWRDLYQSKQQFEVAGSTRYRMRWWRARLQPFRSIGVLISAAGAVKRPRALRRTVESGLVSNKLVWAGNCYLDFAAIGVSGAEQQLLETRLADVLAIPEPHERLRASVELLNVWQVRASSHFGPERAHQAFYVTNTLLRWTVLSFLSNTAQSSTWFFGRDNLGLGLELELYVHNLVSSNRVAFLEFGGKTSETALYPRALHMLHRQFYVIPIGMPGAGDDVIATVERIQRGIAANAREFFQHLEHRRRTLYARFPADCSLRDVQKSVWTDFAAA